MLQAALLRRAGAGYKPAPRNDAGTLIADVSCRRCGYNLRGLSRDVKEAVMTYAGDMFSWYAGSIEADTYFCPERHGTYFGSFYLKDAPAVGNPGYSIDTTLTGNLGAALLAVLDPEQAALITGLVDQNRTTLGQIVDTRRAVAAPSQCR